MLLGWGGGGSREDRRLCACGVGVRGGVRGGVPVRMTVCCGIGGGSRRMTVCLWGGGGVP